jgi:DNA-binding SARP family transcriptional activator
MPQPTISVQLLGGFELCVDGEPEPVPPSSQRLVAYLALRDGPVSRASVAAALWPDATERRAAACLRSTLCRLAKPADALLVNRPGTLAIGPSVEVDLVTVRHMAADLARGAHPLSAFPRLTALTADLLPDWADPWVTAERDWFHQLCLRTLEMLSEHLRTHGDIFQAHEAAAAAVRSDPLRESAHRRLIEVHIADGNPAAALHQYSTYRAHLREELGLAPSEEIRALLHPLMAQGNLRRHSVA